jgi:hypothetical protein
LLYGWEYGRTLMLDQRFREGTEAVKAALADTALPAAEELLTMENLAARDRVGWRGPLIAVVTAAVVLAVVAAAALVFRGGESSIDPAATTIPAPEPIQLESLVWSRVPHDAAVFHLTEDEYVSDVVAGGPGFVAVGTTGSDGAVWTSPDGLTWTFLRNNEPHGEHGDRSIMSITTGGPGLVAVGYTFDTPDVGGFSAAVWTSEDGISWSKTLYSEAAFGSITSEPRPGAGNTMMRDVTEGGPGLVAVGSDAWSAAVWTSSDGITWSRVPDDPEVFGYGRTGESSWRMSQVVAGESGFVAVGSVVWTSPDGLNWSVRPDAPDIRAVAATKSGFVGVGSEETIEDACDVEARGDCTAAVWTSSDGITWNRVPNNDAVFGGGPDKQWVSDVTTVGDQVVAVGTSVWASPDGLTWSRIYTPELRAHMYAVAAGPSNLVVVGGDGAHRYQEEEDGSAVVWVGTPSEPPG